MGLSRASVAAMQTDPENPTAKMKPIFDELFKFKIGEVVAHTHQIATDTAELVVNADRFESSAMLESTKWNAPTPFTIVARWVEECHGGIQIHYSVHGNNSDGKLFEFELVPYQEAVESRDRLRGALAKSNDAYHEAKARRRAELRDELNKD